MNFNEYLEKIEKYIKKKIKLIKIDKNPDKTFKTKI